MARSVSESVLQGCLAAALLGAPLLAADARMGAGRVVWEYETHG